MKPLTQVVILLLLGMSGSALYAQEISATPDAGKIASSYLNAITDKSASVSHDIDKQTDKYLFKFQREEARIYKKLAKRDSTAAARGLAASQGAAVISYNGNRADTIKLDHFSS